MPLLSRLIERRLANLEPPLSLTQLLMLRTIAGGAGSGTDLAHAAGVSGPAVSQLVGGLAEAGLIERTEIEGDRRRQALRLSAQGVQVLTQTHAALHAELSQIIGTLPPPEAHALGSALATIEAVLAGTPPPRRPPPRHPGPHERPPRRPPPPRHPRAAQAAMTPRRIQAARLTLSVTHRRFAGQRPRVADRQTIPGRLVGSCARSRLLLPRSDNVCILECVCYNPRVSWEIEMTDEFEAWFLASKQPLQEKVVAMFPLIRENGPSLSRPFVDTIHGSRFPNMKELRPTKTVRVFFAFDPRRTAILLLGADKAGRPQGRWYREMVRRADDLYARHLEGAHDVKEGR